MENQNMSIPILINAAELATILGVKLGCAYKIIRIANQHMAAAGKITVRGRANRAYVMRMLDAGDI